MPFVCRYRIGLHVHLHTFFFLFYSHISKYVCMHTLAHMEVQAHLTTPPFAAKDNAHIFLVAISILFYRFSMPMNFDHRIRRESTKWTKQYLITKSWQQKEQQQRQRQLNKWIKQYMKYRIPNTEYRWIDKLSHAYGVYAEKEACNSAIIELVPVAGCTCMH